MRSTPHLDWLVLTKRIHSCVGMIDAAGGWPSNARLGVTIGTQEDADEDLPTLVELSQNLGCGNFVSVEPMLDRIVMGDAMPGLNWVICGAESVPGQRLGRPLQVDWVRSLRDQCAADDVPFFYKQGPVDGRLTHMPELDGRTWAEVPR